MSSNFWLTEDKFNKIRHLLPNEPRGVPRVEDRRVLSGIFLQSARQSLVRCALRIWFGQDARQPRQAAVRSRRVATCLRCAGARDGRSFYADDPLSGHHCVIPCRTVGAKRLALRFPTRRGGGSARSTTKAFPVYVGSPIPCHAFGALGTLAIPLFQRKLETL